MCGVYCEPRDRSVCLPLRLPEIFVMACAHHVFPQGPFKWIAQSSDVALLYYILQLPFSFLIGAHPIGVRLLSSAFAAAACYAFFRLAKENAVSAPLLAVDRVFAFPIHVEVATEGLPVEQALFLLTVATILFLRLILRPQTTEAVLYVGALTLCLYTYPYFCRPTIGYALFVFRCFNRAQERKLVFTKPHDGG